MSSKNYQRILVVTDGLNSSEPTHQTALNLAREHNANITLVDTLRPPSAITRWFSSNAGDVFEMVLADKQERLEKIAEEFRAAGIEIETKVLLGNSSEAITLEAVDGEADLVIRYRKGVHSKYTGAFGNTARILMRYCPKPLLLVRETPIDQPRVLACFDVEHSDKENNSIIDESYGLAGDKQRLFGIYCWSMWGEDLVRKRMTEKSLKESLDFNERLHRQLFENFSERHDLSCFGAGLRFEHGRPAVVIPQFCRDEEIDVVVMCSASLNHPLMRYFGSTIESVIDQLPCALMVVKPIGYVSPIAASKKSATA